MLRIFGFEFDFRSRLPQIAAFATLNIENGIAVVTRCSIVLLLPSLLSCRVGPVSLFPSFFQETSYDTTARFRENSVENGISFLLDCHTTTQPFLLMATGPAPSNQIWGKGRLHSNCATFRPQNDSFPPEIHRVRNSCCAMLHRSLSSQWLRSLPHCRFPILPNLFITKADILPLVEPTICPPTKFALLYRVIQAAS